MYLYDSFRGKHDCLVPVTPYLADLFNYLRIHKKKPPRVRAIDMRHVLLLLPFLLDGLLADEVLKHNRAHPLNPVLDPSSELIGVTMVLIQWLHTVHTSGTWNTVRLCFHIPMDMAIQSLPRGRITVCDILVEMLHAIVMLSM